MLIREALGMLPGHVEPGQEGFTVPPPHFPEAGGPARALVPPSVTVREGYLLKRKEEPAGLATRFAFKKRYFWLSGETLSYSKSPEWQVGLQSAGRGFSW